MAAITEKLSIKEKVGYALGDTASCLFWSTFTCYLMYFYTDVFVLPAAFTLVAAFLMFFSKLDAKTVNRVAYELEVRRKNN